MKITYDNIPPNVRRLGKYINSQPDPEAFAAALFALAKPRLDDVPDSQKEVEVIVR